MNNYSSYKTAVVGITKNNADCISRGISNMLKISSLFKESIVYIYENDSTDNTVEILDHYKQKNPSKFFYTSENNVASNYYRTQNIAQARQKTLDWVRNNFKDFDILIIIDPDLYYDINIHGIIDSFNNINKWDVCFANGIYNNIGMTWDAFAFRCHDQNDPWRGNNSYFTKLHSKRDWGTGRIIKDWTEVYSAFGGIGIYKSKCIKNVNYDLKNIDCEHVSFHNSISKNVMFNKLDHIDIGTQVVYIKNGIYQLATVKCIHTDDAPNLYYTILLKAPTGEYEKQTTSEYLYTYKHPTLMINPAMIRIYSRREGVTRGYGSSSFR